MVAEMSRPVAAAGAAMAAVAVALGAFGAHALKHRLDEAELGWWRTAVDYQMWHALALLALGLAGGRRLGGPAALLGAGAALFSATLYAMALGAPRWLGAVTPAGGALMIAGWAWLVLRLLGASRPERHPGESRDLGETLRDLSS
jgi:uncharacterized membrane protein YgdD (TMEM256/DUF423 family)